MFPFNTRSNFLLRSIVVAVFYVTALIDVVCYVTKVQLCKVHLDVFSLRISPRLSFRKGLNLIMILDFLTLSLLGRFCLMIYDTFWCRFRGVLDIQTFFDTGRWAVSDLLTLSDEGGGFIWSLFADVINGQHEITYN